MSDDETMELVHCFAGCHLFGSRPLGRAPIRHMGASNAHIDSSWKNLLELTPPRATVSGK